MNYPIPFEKANTAAIASLPLRAAVPAAKGTVVLNPAAGPGELSYIVVTVPDGIDPEPLIDGYQYIDSDNPDEAPMAAHNEALATTPKE